MTFAICVGMVTTLATVLPSGTPSIGAAVPEIAFVRLAAKKKVVAPGLPATVLRVSAHDLDPIALTAGAPNASIEKFFKLGGKVSLRFVFAAELDGAPGDELVVVNEFVKGGGRLDLDVVAAPAKLEQKKPKIIASLAKGELGATQGDGRVCAMGPLDHDGDGRDSIAIVRTFDDGHQELTVHPIAIEMKQHLAPAIASELTIGEIGAGQVFDCARAPNLFGPDLLVLRKLDAGGPRIELVASPQQLGDPGGPVVACYTDASATDGAPIVRVTTLIVPREDSPFPDCQILIEREPAAGGRRIEIVPLPLTLSAKLPALPAFDASAAGLGDGKDLAFAIGLRRVQ